MSTVKFFSKWSVVLDSSSYSSIFGELLVSTPATLNRIRVQ